MTPYGIGLRRGGRVRRFDCCHALRREISISAYSRRVSLIRRKRARAQGRADAVREIESEVRP